MLKNQDDLREELLAVFRAHRELPADVDEELVDGLLSRISAVKPRPDRFHRLRATYGKTIPVKWSTVLGIAVAQGIVILVLGEYMIKRVLDLYSYSSVFAPAWMMFGVMWLILVLTTVAVIAALAPRKETRSSRDARRRRMKTQLF